MASDMVVAAVEDCAPYGGRKQSKQPEKLPL